MWRLLRCVAAVVLLSLFVAAVAGLSWAIVDGPEGIRRWALILVFVVAGLVVMGFWTVLLLARAGAGLVGICATVIAGVVALIFAGTVPAWFSEWLLYERGRVTTCRVLSVTEVETFNGSGSAYQYRVDCGSDGNLTVTQSDPTLKTNQRVPVRHDPEGKMEKARLANDTKALKPEAIAWMAVGELGFIVLVSLAVIVTGRPEADPPDQATP